MEKISKHISYTEATRSNTAKKLGIPNGPNPSQLEAMKLLAEKVFEPVRKFFGAPIYVSSFFRSKKVNEAIKGANTSQHLCNNGAAMDLDADVYGKISNKEIFLYILNNLEFDQLIWEFGTDSNPDWVHVSYKKTGNRHEPLVAYKDKNGKTSYKKYEKR